MLNYAPQNLLSGMTRVEMLIALYDRAILHTESQARDLAAGNPSGAAFHKFKSQKMLNGIHCGIDQDGSELADNLNRLLEFCSSQVASDEPRPATKTLQILRDAWLEIRDEANALEASGVIPPIGANTRSVELSV